MSFDPLAIQWIEPIQDLLWVRIETEATSSSRLEQLEILKTGSTAFDYKLNGFLY